MPQLGETVTEGTITKWYKQVGDSVAADEALFEVSTDKVDTDVPSPVAGLVTEIVAGEGATIPVGALIARVGDAPEVPRRARAGRHPPADAPSAPPPHPKHLAPPPRRPPPATVAGARLPAASRRRPPAPAPAEAPAPAGDADGDDIVLSPVVRRLIAEHDLDATALEGTGLGGRITRADVERAIQGQRPQIDGAASAPSPAPAARAAAAGARRHPPVPAPPPPHLAPPRARRARATPPSRSTTSGGAPPSTW